MKRFFRAGLLTAAWLTAADAGLSQQRTGQPPQQQKEDRIEQRLELDRAEMQLADNMDRWRDRAVAWADRTPSRQETAAMGEQAPAPAATTGRDGTSR